MGNYDDSDEDDGWVPDAALEALIMEKELHPGETNSGTSKRLLEENAPVVAQSMIRLAIHSKSERIRFDAGRYVLDRVLGPVANPNTAHEESPITKLINEITEFANTAGNNGRN